MARTTTLFGSGGVLSANGDGSADKLGKGAYRWVDIDQPTEDDLHWLETTYNFHPLTIEDCQHFDQRAKVEDYDSYLFITMAVPRRLPIYHDMQADELHCYLGADYLVTVHTDPLGAVDRTRQRLGSDRGKLKTSPDFLMYLIMDQMVDGYFGILDDMEDEVERLEDEIVTEPKRQTLHNIFTLKQQLVYMRKTAGPERELFHALSGRRYAQISSHTDLYFRDIYDHIVRIFEGIETSRDLLSNGLEAYLSVVSNRLNDIMKRLTLVATIFMPLSFIVGFGGMNFQALPFASRTAFIFLLAVMLATPVLMLLWFWRKEWM
jgi:magnesium transporter